MNSVGNRARTRRRLHAGLLSFACIVGLARAHAQPLDTPTPGAQRSGEPSPGTRIRDDQASDSARDPAAETSERILRAVQLRWAPSFSPYVELRHIWTQQGSWFVATTEGVWSAPWPASRQTQILGADERAAFLVALEAADMGTQAAACEDAAQPLPAGVVELRGQYVDDEGVEDRCVRFAPAVDTPPALYTTLAAYAPDVEAVDRWTHPFWLTTESGILRIELDGTAEAFVDNQSLGVVEGVVVVRLLPESYALRFVAPDGSERLEHTQIRREQVTVLRLRMQAEAAVAQ